MIKRIKDDLIESYIDKPHRLEHVYAVVDTALELGKQYHLNLETLEIAALLHDITKYNSIESNITWIKQYYDNADDIIEEFTPPLYHAFSAVAVANIKYGITDLNILGAIEHHTVGKPNMNPYEEVIFVSDYIEPNRVYKECKIARKYAKESLIHAIYYAIHSSIQLYENEGHKIPMIAYKARDYYKQKWEDEYETTSSNT